MVTAQESTCATKLEACLKSGMSIKMRVKEPSPQRREADAAKQHPPDAQAATQRLAAVPDSEALALLQVRLLAAARGVFQMARICMGPLVVTMSTEYNYTAEQKGQILSAFAAGYALTQVAGGMLADRFGGAPLLLFGLVTSGGSLLLVPLAADAGVRPLCWLLWVMGFTQGPTYPAQLVTTAKWATGSLRSYASALGGAGSTAGSLLALGLTPMLAKRVGWKITAGTFGGLTLAFGAIWHCKGLSSPVSTTTAAAASVSPTVPSGKEVLLQLKPEMLKKYLGILLAPSVLVIFVAHSIHNFVRYFLMAWMPTFYSDVLRVSADAAGLQQVLPELCGLLCSLAGASVGKSLQDSGRLSALGCRRVFSSVAFLGGCFGLLAVSQMTTSYAVTASLCFVQGLMTLQGLGFGANYLDISKHHGGLITGAGNTVATGASFLAPVFAAWILSDQDASEAERWHRLFCAFAGSNLVGLAFYFPLCSTTPVDLQGGEAAAGQKAKAS
mmetsp:Transcript_103966/g.335226  ORF Transcript_103966/g.335226 Transcript_103966/m.335226 type:complete len:500 (+) Transcript_103966:86-1585(+)